MTEVQHAPFLHVANGTCTTRVIEAAGIPGRLSIWADPLHDGPVPGGLSDSELLEVRARHLADPAPAGDAANELSAWREAIDRHRSYDELILWFEHDLFDQLNLVQLLTWIRERLPAAKPVSLVCIGSFPGHARFKGLGELSAGELGLLLGTRQPISEAQFSLAQLAWDAFRAATPEALDNLRRTDTAALPYLAAAIERFLEEYPWTSDGLSRSERRLLQLAVDGSIELSVAYPRLHDDEEAYYITDRSVEALAESLSRTSPPLLTRTPSRLTGDRPLHGSVTLSDMGRAVLVGRQDRITLCGIDRWFGGVHLHGGAPVWRWDDRHQGITRG